MKYRNTKIDLKILCAFTLLIAQLFFNLNFFNATVQASEITNQIDQIYISEGDYSDKMNDIVEPYLLNKVQSGYLTGDKDVKLYYEKYKVENPKGNIVLSHGYTESLVKYHELIFYFMKNGYNVFGIEHRGHGRSGSLGIADKTQVHVDDFNQYVVDFKTFMDEIVMPSNDNKKVLLYAHSMGGAIGAKFLEDYPDYFNGAILNAPMLQVNTGNIPEFLAKIIVEIQVAIGNGGKYVLGKEPYNPKYDLNTINTTSFNRFKYCYDIVDNDEELQRGGASYNWTNEAFKATAEIIKEKNASKVEIPVLLFQAGQDFMVKPEGQNLFAKGAKNCKIVRIENSRHQIFAEKDEILKPYLEDVLNFYDNI